MDLVNRIYNAVEAKEDISDEDLLALHGMKQKIRPWLCIRKFSIGASALGGIIGQSDWIHSEEAMERYLKPQPFSWWAQRSINHGARYESVATIMFQNEFQNSLLSEGETFELVNYGMIKCNTYPGLHCSPDGVVHHTLKDGTMLFIIEMSKLIPIYHK